MPTIDEQAAENTKPDEIAQQKLQQQPQARFVGPQPQEATSADARGATGEALGQQCEASGEHNPAQIDKGAKGGALAVERAPFARQRRVSGSMWTSSMASSSSLKTISCSQPRELIILSIAGGVAAGASAAVAAGTENNSNSKTRTVCLVGDGPPSGAPPVFVTRMPPPAELF
jgi:hypothetical protein